MYKAFVIFANRTRLQLQSGSYEQCKLCVEQHVEMLTEYERSARHNQHFSFEIRQTVPGERWELYTPVETQFRTIANYRCSFSVEEISSE